PLRRRNSPFRHWRTPPSSISYTASTSTWTTSWRAGSGTSSISSASARWSQLSNPPSKDNHHDTYDPDRLSLSAGAYSLTRSKAASICRSTTLCLELGSCAQARTLSGDRQDPFSQCPQPGTHCTEESACDSVATRDERPIAPAGVARSGARIPGVLSPCP